MKSELLKDVRQVCLRFEIELNRQAEIDMGKYKPLERNDVRINFTFGKPFHDWSYKGTPITFTYHWN